MQESIGKGIGGRESHGKQINVSVSLREFNKVIKIKRNSFQEATILNAIASTYIRENSCRDSTYTYRPCPLLTFLSEYRTHTSIVACVFLSL